jgi:DNA-binding response OmpR family regulator
MRDQAANLGVVAYFTKPFSPSELVSEARKQLGL